MRRSLLLPRRPAEIMPATPAMLARYDARSLALGDAAVIASWPDDTGNGWAMAQATGSKQPLLQQTFINNVQGALFDGGNDLVVVANQVSVSAAGTVLVVYQPRVATAHTLFSSCDEASTTRLLSFSVTAAGLPSIQQRNNDTQDLVVGSLVTPVGRAAVLGVTAQAGGYSLRVNGVTDPNLTVSSGTNSGDWLAATTARDNMAIGALKRTTEVTFASGAFGFVGVWDSVLAPIDLIAWERWLGRTWKIPVA